MRAALHYDAHTFGSLSLMEFFVDFWGFYYYDIGLIMPNGDIVAKEW